MSDYQLEEQLNKLPRPRVRKRSIVFFYLKLVPRVAHKSLKSLFLNINYMNSRIALGSVATLVVVVGFVGYVGYVYAAPSVTMGDSLYPLKTSLENWKLKRAETPLEKVGAYTDISLRRLAEAQVLARELGNTGALSFLRIPTAHAQQEEVVDGKGGGTSDFIIIDGKGSDPLTATIEEMVLATEQAIESAEEISNPVELQVALEVVATTQEAQVEGLEEVAASVGAEASAEVVETVAIALETTVENQEEVAATIEVVEAVVTAGEETVTVEIATVADEAAALATTEVTPEVTSKEKERVEAVKAELDAWKADLLASGVDPLAADKLFTRVGTKIEKAEQALASGNVHQAAGLLKASKALTNNAKHFSKKPVKGVSKQRNTVDAAAPAAEAESEALAVPVVETSTVEEVSVDESAVETTDAVDTVEVIISDETAPVTNVVPEASEPISESAVAPVNVAAPAKKNSPAKAPAKAPAKSTDKRTDVVDVVSETPVVEQPAVTVPSDKNKGKKSTVETPVTDTSVTVQPDAPVKAQGQNKTKGRP